MCHTQIREGKHRNGHTPALVSHWTGAVQFSVAFPGLSSSPPVPSAHSQHHLTFLQPLCPASPSSTSHLACFSSLHLFDPTTHLGFPASLSFLLIRILE